MSGKHFILIVLVCSLVSSVSITLLAYPARADDCLAAPGPATPGAHWYYRTEKATQKKCWHSGTIGQVSSEASSEVASSQMLQTLLAPSPPVATPKNGISEKDAQKLYVQFLEWKRRTGQ